MNVLKLVLLLSSFCSCYSFAGVAPTCPGVCTLTTFPTRWGNDPAGDGYSLELNGTQIMQYLDYKPAVAGTYEVFPDAKTAHQKSLQDVTQLQNTGVCTFLN